ncbi:hypothetical protein H9P43_001027 [Blastocladiella emersonii ATCC 22665]|nr:hypothetical protein H9P43_001027 [Blastocladiella emersonii ATCC 22665]
MLRRLYSTAASNATRTRINPVGLNRVTLLGRVTDAVRANVLNKDDVEKSGAQPRYATTVTMSTSDKKIVIDGEGKETASYLNQYHKVVTFDRGAHDFLTTAVRPGMSLYVEGKLVTEKYTDKEGNTRYSTSVQASAPHGRIVIVNQHVPEGFARVAAEKEEHASSGSSGSGRDHYTGQEIPL